MFAPDMVGRVNRDRVGMYGPEELLVVGPAEVRWLETGWNLFLRPFGRGWCRIVDARGNPPHPPIPMAPADLDGVEVLGPGFDLERLVPPEWLPLPEVPR